MLGEQIRDLRMAKNLSQVQLAERLGVTKQTVSNWENNNILPSVDMLKHIANYFHCNTDYLLEMNEGKVYIETTYLTLEQTMHLQQLVDDLITLNKQLTTSQETK
ncbi:MAG: helix-turn-helix transcriptional regulator [Lachnospiraceae bacterium]|nr:helix-turn-helix transcriptional regulator [Lachnospiraceae bacterium]